MLNIKGRKASSNRRSLHVPFSFLLARRVCDERIFHKIYLTRAEIISALLFWVWLCMCFYIVKCAAQKIAWMYPHQSLTLFEKQPKKRNFDDEKTLSQFKDKKISVLGNRRDGKFFFSAFVNLFLPSEINPSALIFSRSLELPLPLFGLRTIALTMIFCLWAQGTR